MSRVSLLNDSFGYLVTSSILWANCCWRSSKKYETAQFPFEILARIFVLFASLKHLVEPLLEAVGMAKDNLKREDEFVCLFLDCAATTLGSVHGQIEDTVI